MAVPKKKTSKAKGRSRRAIELGAAATRAAACARSATRPRCRTSCVRTAGGTRAARR